MDALFVVDVDYPSFGEAWTDLERLLPLSGGLDGIRVEPFRITFGNAQNEELQEKLGITPTEMGWHFAGNPKDEKYIEALTQQAELLIKKGERFRISAHPTGQANLIELRFDPPKPIHLALPFEDALKNLPRFLGFYLPAFASGYHLSLPKMKTHLENFYNHCLTNEPKEIPYQFETGGKVLWLGTKLTKQSWVPRFGKVGRHDLFKELHIFQGSGKLINLLAQLEQLGKKDPIQIYLQFFVPTDHPTDRLIPKNYGYETTLLYRSLPFFEAQKVKNQLTAWTHVANPIRDTFAVFEQPKAEIGQKASATYMLRRTVSRGYEIRLHATWEDDHINPEDAVVPLEQKTGLTLAKLL